MSQNRTTFREWGEFNKVIAEIYEKYDKTHGAVALISGAHTFLQYYTPRINEALRENAENLLSRINWGSTILDVGILMDVLNRPENVTRSSQALLRDLFNDLTILLALADPWSQDRLRILNEQRVLGSALQRSPFRDSFQVKTLPSCHLSDLEESLHEYKPRIIHFSGHGSERGLVFENARRSDIAMPSKLVAMLTEAREDNLQAVILNACYSTTQAQSIANTVGRVIAMEGHIGDNNATRFTESFYRALGAGRSFDSAFN